MCAYYGFFRYIYIGISYSIYFTIIKYSIYNYKELSLEN